MSTEQPSLSLLIVTYNPGAEILNCLQAVTAATAHLTAEIIVIDNASNDGTAALVRERLPAVKVIANPENVGFGTANNIGFRQSTGQYIMLVNPDLILNRQAVDTMLTYLLEHPQTGVVGPKMLHEDGSLGLTARPDYRPWRILSQFIGIARLFPTTVYGRYKQLNQSADQPFATDWMAGACLLFPRTIYEQLKGFDEGLFLYMEDVDICIRTKALGYAVIFLPSAVVTHVGGSTTSRFPLIRVRHYHKSPIHYYRRRHDRMSILILKLGFTFELIMKLILRSILGVVTRSSQRLNHAKAEAIVLGELWGY